MSEITAYQPPVTMYLTQDLFTRHHGRWSFVPDHVAMNDVARQIDQHGALRMPLHPGGIMERGFDFVIGASTREVIDAGIRQAEGQPSDLRLYAARNLGRCAVFEEMPTLEVVNNPWPTVGLRPDRDAGRLSGDMLAADLMGLDPYTLEDARISSSPNEALAYLQSLDRAELLGTLRPRLPLAILTSLS